jgi:hypothetical protein
MNERGSMTLNTVMLSLTLLGVAGVVIVAIAMAFAGFTGFGVIVLALFAVQAGYGFMLYRKLPAASRLSDPSSQSNPSEDVS